MNPPYQTGVGLYHYYFFRCPLSFAQPDANTEWRNVANGAKRKNKKRSRKNYSANFFSGGLVSFHVEERDQERSRHNRNVVCQLAGGFVFECSAVADCSVTDLHRVGRGIVREG